MKTRSQSKTVHFTELDVFIDFDEASAAWNSNKKRLSHGLYVYVCGNPLKNGGYCKKTPYKNDSCCHLHTSCQ